MKFDKIEIVLAQKNIFILYGGYYQKLCPPNIIKTELAMLSFFWFIIFELLIKYNQKCQLLQRLVVLRIRNLYSY